MPDLTTLTAQVEADKTAVQSAQAALDAANATLATDEAALASLTFINQIENLTPDEVTSINAQLESFGSKVTLVIAP